MVYSNSRKLMLSAWLKKNSEREYNNSLKLQKFLFFYESFSKVAGDTADFDHLRGYKNGPVFSNVWGDYTKEHYEFEMASEESYKKFGGSINQDRALQCAFIVATLSESELSALTHKMHIWRSKERLINQNFSQVSLYESDFNESDTKIIEMLSCMYPVEMVRMSEVIQLDNFYFVISKEDFKTFTEEHIDILLSIIQNEDAKKHLNNPVYIEIEGGKLIID